MADSDTRTDAPVADSSSAPSDPSTVLASLTDAQRATWTLTGELPDSTPVEKPNESLADSTPAAPDAQAVSTETTQPPASEPGTPPKKDAESRKAELRAEIEGLLAERRRLQQEIGMFTPTPAAPVSPPALSLAQTIQAPDVAQPIIAEEEFFSTFPDAKLGDYARYTARYEIVRERNVVTHEQAVTARRQTYHQRMQTALEKNPQWLDGIPDHVLNLLPVDQLPPSAPVTPLNVVAQEIFTADRPDLLIAHFGSHPEDLDSIARLSDVAAIARRIGRLEASLVSTVPPPAPAGKPVSSAPVPPDTLGRKPSVPSDEIEAALASGDVRRYQDLVNRKEMAATTH